MAAPSKPTEAPTPSSQTKVKPPGHSAEEGKAGKGLSGGVDTGAIQPGKTGSHNP